MGNINALKHGYYSRFFRQLEAADLKKLDEEDGLSGEITLLRVLIRRVFEASQHEDDNLDTWMNSLKTLAMACTRLAALVKAQKSVYGGEDSELAAILDLALSEVTREKGIDARFNPGS